MTAGVETNIQSDSGSHAKPLLFLHVPKTAGTSFILALQNLFGDRRVTRLDFNASGFESDIERCASGAAPEIACLTGHVPVQYFTPHWNEFVPFTMLRHPVRRVFSLYRFLKTTLRTQEQLDHHGLRPGFGFMDFIACRHPRVHGQTNNGMVRFLCGDKAANDPEADAFWSGEKDTEFLLSALEVLKHVPFGMTEHMQETSILIKKLFEIPFDLEIARENESKPDDTNQDVTYIQKVVEKNALDLALYERALSLFWDRFGHQYCLGTPIPPVVFRPVLGVQYPLDQVEGRQGFYNYERTGFAWLGPAGRGTIYFLAPAELCHVNIKLYSITKEYASNNITIKIDGINVPFEISNQDQNWNNITTSTFKSSRRIMKLEIISPFTIPIQYINPGAMDRRGLSVAVSNITFVL
jgi:hypothetical protein